MVNDMEPKRIQVSRIVLDKDLQTRAKVDRETITNYAEAIESGTKFPPVDVFEFNGNLHLVDGFHRFKAFSEELAAKTVLCNVRKGTKADALQFALGANHAHGLHRTNADKQRAVAMALDSFSDWSDGKIADLVGVNQSTVFRARVELMQSIGSKSQPTIRTGKDGKRRKAPKKKKPTEPKPTRFPREEQNEEPEETQNEQQQTTTETDDTAGLMRLKQAWKLATIGERDEFLDWCRK